MRAGKIRGDTAVVATPPVHKGESRAALSCGSRCADPPLLLPPITASDSRRRTTGATLGGRRREAAATEVGAKAATVRRHHGLAWRTAAMEHAATGVCATRTWRCLTARSGTRPRCCVSTRSAAQRRRRAAIGLRAAPAGVRSRRHRGRLRARRFLRPAIPGAISRAPRRAPGSRPRRPEPLPTRRASRLLATTDRVTIVAAGRAAVHSLCRARALPRRTGGRRRRPGRSAPNRRATTPRAELVRPPRPDGTRPPTSASALRRGAPSLRSGASSQFRHHNAQGSRSSSRSAARSSIVAQ